MKERLERLENEECFDIVSGQIPIYAYESRVEIANKLFSLSIKEKISFKEAWNVILRKEYM